LLLSSDELDDLFANKGESLNSQKKLEFLFNSYKEVINELKVIDLDGNVFGLRKRTSGSVISFYSKTTPIDIIKPKIIFSDDNKTISYTQPLTDEFSTYGYVQIEMNLDAFFISMFNNFNIKDYHFQWIIKPSGVVFNTLNADFVIPGFNNLKETILGNRLTSMKHTILIGGQKRKLLTIFRRLKINDEHYYMAFSLPVTQITSYIVRNAFIVGAITLLVILFFIVWSITNIHNKTEEEKRLKQSQETLRKMLYYLPAGIVLVDNNNHIRQVNKTALNIFSFDDEDQMLGQEALDDVLFENYQNFEKSEYSANSFKYALTNKQEEEIIVLVEKIPFFLQSQRFTINMFIEVSSLDLKEKMNGGFTETKSNFIANISHELRTPLNGIIGMTDLLMGAALPSQEKDMLSVVKRSADTLLTLINDILDFSKIEAGKFEVESIQFNMKDEIENTVYDFQAKAKENNIQLSWASSIPLPKDFIGDPIRLRQVLNNLISNAIKFTPVNGHIELNISETKALNGSRAIRFSIKDSGIGISKEKLGLIFKPFSQADGSTTRKYGGTGLGTTISKQLVNLMGGEIKAKSPSGLSDNPKYPGAEFVFTLRFRTNKHTKLLDFSKITDPSNIKALIITDDRLQVQSITKNLASLHIEYDKLTPSNETIDILKEESKYHIIIIDNRPDFNGLEFLNELHNHKLHSKFLIIVQSADYEQANTSVAKQLGADIYLRKPVKLIVLKEFISQHFPGIDTSDLATQTVLEKNLKVLVAEDNKLNQRVIQNLFKRFSITVDIAENGAIAVKMATEKDYDMIFMDIFMPEMDGVAAVKELKSSGNNCPTIGMTASTNLEEKNRAMKAGMDDYIIKPVKLEELSRMITKWSTK
jgi:signal transduction histidine kinase/CheY-like chemotaxis protein